MGRRAIPAAGAPREAKAVKRRRGRPKTGRREPWKAVKLSKATYYRRVRGL